MCADYRGNLAVSLEILGVLGVRRQESLRISFGSSGRPEEKGEEARFWGRDVLGNLAVSLEILGFLGACRQECPKQLRTSKPQVGKAAKEERGEEEDQQGAK